MRKTRSESTEGEAPNSLLDTEAVSWGFSARSDGNMSLSYGDVSHSPGNRIAFLKKLKIDYRALVCAKQVHGSRLACVTAKDKGRGALNFESSLDGCDGLMTDVRRVPLAVFSADCAVAFLYDPLRPAVGLVHAGWRGTKEHILEKALLLMRERFKTKISAVRVAFAPAIRKCCYEVGKEFLEYFPSSVARKGDSFFFDLVGANRSQLAAQPIPARNIFDTGICTACKNTQYFSHRKEAQSCGRMMSAIMLK